MSTTAHIVGPEEGHEHTHTVIFQHGIDSEASEFATDFLKSEAHEAPESDRTLRGLYPHIRLVFPQAPRVPSARFGPALEWFNLWSLENPEAKSELQ